MHAPGAPRRGASGLLGARAAGRDLFRRFQ